jgi:hypothetical protein
METHDFDLRYDGRVLGFHAVCNTDRDINAMGQQIRRVAIGPKLDAALMWCEGYEDGADMWDDTCKEVNVPNAFTLRYERRVLAFHIYVNTESEGYHIHKRILQIAKGPNQDACLCWTESFVGENGEKIWGELQQIATKVAANPNSKSFSQ